MSDASCRHLTSPEDRAAAHAIVERAYRAQGYAITDSISHYLASDQAATFGLFDGTTLIGTISIVHDGPDGLPMDTLYADELAPWRTAGKTLAEAVQFAVDPDARTLSPFQAGPLFAAVLSEAIRSHTDYLCISINPKHDRFYAMLGFEKIGEEKQYAAVAAPAIARAFFVPEWQKSPLIAGLLKKEYPDASF